MAQIVNKERAQEQQQMGMMHPQTMNHGMVMVPVVGGPQYMAPQQLRGLDFDSSSSDESEDEKDATTNNSRKMVIIGSILVVLIVGIAVYFAAFQDKEENKEVAEGDEIKVENKPSVGAATELAAKEAEVKQLKKELKEKEKKRKAEEKKRKEREEQDSDSSDDAVSPKRNSKKRRSSPSSEKPSEAKKEDADKKDWGNEERNKRARGKCMCCSVETFLYGCLAAMVFFLIVEFFSLCSCWSETSCGYSVVDTITYQDLVHCVAGCCAGCSCYSAFCSWCYIRDGETGMWRACCVLCCYDCFC